MNSNAQKYSKLQWTDQEQECLKELKQEQNLKSWKTIAGIMNSRFQDKDRNGKQCRERYMNYVRFNKQKPKAIGWKYEDDVNLFENFFQFGAKWVLISQHMPERSENCLKNRFYGALRRIIRKINKVEKQKKLKYKKSIKYDSLIRILSYKNFSNKSAQKSNLAENLREALVKLAINQMDDLQSDEIISLIVKIHNFNCIGKNTSSKRTTSYQTFDDFVMVSSAQLIQNTKNINQDLPFADKQQSKNQNKHIEISQNAFEEYSQSSIMQIISQYNLNKNSFRNTKEDLFQILCGSSTYQNQFYC